ncbi:MAG: CoA transferase [Rhodospirillaceae bacterium]|jgi:CoA:oxalate CoA-transferase|nr:CoA transferase [Rhodospirillaceae bacterium]MBT6202884.1 CoA transferase [Rhodospirillaceae bacterium]MBT7613188.1 CoA transferase [Rhodospirillaceae bacterium]
MAEGPLSGITIVDMTRVLAGPYCTMVLSDLGARVIKVEQPGTGDEARGTGPFLGPVSGYFASINRGKESIALNLKEDNDREVFRALVGGADVLIENYRPGVMKKLGFGWDVLHAEFPSLIYAAVSGFGHSGPYSERAAYDMVVQAMGGVMSLTGHPGGEPTRVGTSMGDITAALFAAIGICSSLYHRAQTGQGQMIDIGMLDCQVAVLENAIARYSATGEIPGPLGARHPSIVPFDAFKTADSHIIIAAGNDGLFVRLCEALGRPEIAKDERYLKNALRAQHVDALGADMESVLTTNSTEHWLGVIQGAGVPCGAINNIAQVIADPHVQARNMVVTTHDKDAGTIRLSGNPIKLSGFSDPETRGAVPKLDEHRENLMFEFMK